MKRKFVVEIETENEVNVTTAEDVHLALVRYFVMGVYIRVEEAAQHGVHPTGGNVAAICNCHPSFGIHSAWCPAKPTSG